jgi:ribosomal protein S18 acetylase RimI-like enzyme
VVIRPYQLGDREAVRKICCDTADAGEPVENFFHDRELIADLVTRYYTDYEPQSSWVAEADGRVVGYLNGCLDSRRYRRALAGRIVPMALLRAIGRGALARRQTWRWLGAVARTLLRGGLERGKSLQLYPAHVHVNVLTDFRGDRVGQRLMERFFQQVKAAGLSGIHASVRGDNSGGCRFFERMGFVELVRRPTVLPKNDRWLNTHTVIYGRKM